MTEEFIRWDKSENLKYQIFENMLLTNNPTKKTSEPVTGDSLLD